jgi:hypothetical protein
MAAADLVQFRRLLADIDLEFGSAATTSAAARPGDVATDHRDPKRRGQ